MPEKKRLDLGLAIFATLVATQLLVWAWRHHWPAVSLGHVRHLFPGGRP
ncbi:hypothetical protein SAMN05443662_0183 [Sulfurivirga caldicuralii]|uniref:Uncharacterized protein n=1 Tax=Sulfurivirga caldicuralii TaxID=364032 RepID=A0A1N6DIS8_9GAMM|nr:hypothetical protein [Sulfurivirga caldicuralii]SIN70721.1 hypothetical protein SAMN05443662_0183 [Sulfurivirga caldicuralii]